MIDVKLSEQEMQALINLIDAGVKATGLTSVTSAAVLLQKLDEAVKAYQQAQAEPQPKAKNTKGE